MKEKGKQIKLKDKKPQISDQLNQVGFENVSTRDLETKTPLDNLSEGANIFAKLDAHIDRVKKEEKANEEYEKQIDEAHAALFDKFDSKEFVPKDFTTKKLINSLESEVGYTSLVRLLHDAYAERIAYYRSEA